ncbi:MAG: 3-methyl-2-oxobutanoate hydroxymethyltransferase, partial [Planctomycetaceae bacterium]|nr:3-methyl-2-oxobutanoate hydroxymethyltransferase [Planctomycetaceae bacterium]
GAGPGCDGQVLVFHDILGFNPDFKPKFVKQYFDFYGQASKALKSFRDDVVKGAFPGDEHSFK